MQSYIVYTGNVGAAATQPQAARTLLSLLTSPAAIELFKSRGSEAIERQGNDDGWVRAARRLEP